MVPRDFGFIILGKVSRQRIRKRVDCGGKLPQGSLLQYGI